MSGAGSGVSPGGMPPDPRTAVDQTSAPQSWREALLSLKTPLGVAAEQGAPALGVPATGQAQSADPRSQTAAPTLAWPAATTAVAFNARPLNDNPTAGE